VAGNVRSLAIIPSMAPRVCIFIHAWKPWRCVGPRVSSRVRFSRFQL